MGLILDTTVIIAQEKGKINFTKWQEYVEAYISSITVAELLVGVDRANTEEKRIKGLAFAEHIIASVSILPFGAEEARIYAKILHNLFEENITIGMHDMIIGATAIARGYPVLTMNIKDFQRIKGLSFLAANETF